MTPVLSSNTTMGMANAAVIHVSWAPVVWNSCWNVPLRAPGSEYATWASSTAKHPATTVPV